MLARLPSLASLEEKSLALAEAIHATTPCSRASVVVFGEERSHYASVPHGEGFKLRDESGGLRRLLFPALGKFAFAGGFYVPHGALRSLAGITNYQPDGDLMVFPLETGEAPIGGLMLDAAQRPSEEAMRDLRVFADVAAWMIAQERAVSAAERESKQSALLGLINERARKTLDRQTIIETVAEDVRVAFGAMRCAVFARDPQDANAARLIACAESAASKMPMPRSVPLNETWMERAFAGSVVSREAVSEENLRDTYLRSAGARAALVVPLVIEGRIDHAIALHFSASHAFDEIDMVMLRSVASHIGLALANVQLYDLERLRRARAESLERVVRMLRDTQTMEEVLLVFAVTVSHEVKLTCAVYEIEGAIAVRRGFRAVESARGGAPERIDAPQILSAFEKDDVVASSSLSGRLRQQLFARSEGAVASLSIDGNLWGFVLFAAPAGAYDWTDTERRVYFRMLASHLELALAGALGFERIQQLARALSESNEFKDDLLAMLAHDFKGPLTVILGYVELLLENASEDVREDLETIYAQTKRLVRLSEDAVTLAQTQAGGFTLERSVHDLRDVVAESVKAHNRGEDRIRFFPPAQPVPVWLDAARFNHVLDNLLMNALKYSHDEVDVRLSSSENNATLTIQDRGIGIPASELGAVFARFGRASNARKKGISGSGVGLYVSRKIVDVHGGSIAVQSTEGEGSTFTVTLPRAPGPHERSLQGRARVQ